MEKEKIHQEKMEALEAAWGAARQGTDYRPFLELLNRKQLEEIASESSLDIKHVRIVSSGPGGRICPACKELDDHVYSITSEMKKPHLPNKSCTCTGYNDNQTGFCLCYYEVVFEDEL